MQKICDSQQQNNTVNGPREWKLQEGNPRKLIWSIYVIDEDQLEEYSTKYILLLKILEEGI